MKNNTQPLYARHDTNGVTDKQPSQISDGFTVLAIGIYTPHTHKRGYYCWLAFNGEGQVQSFARGWLPNTESMSSQVAAYSAVIEALHWIITAAPKAKIELFTNSQHVAKQVNGTWKCNQPHLRVLRDTTSWLLARAGVSLQWLADLKNPRIDELSRIAHLEAREGVDA